MNLVVLVGSTNVCVLFNVNKVMMLAKNPSKWFAESLMMYDRE